MFHFIILCGCRVWILDVCRYFDDILMRLRKIILIYFDVVGFRQVTLYLTLPICLDSNMSYTTKMGSSADWNWRWCTHPLKQPPQCRHHMKANEGEPLSLLIDWQILTYNQVVLHHEPPPLNDCFTVPKHTWTVGQPCSSTKPPLLEKFTI